MECPWYKRLPSHEDAINKEYNVTQKEVEDMIIMIKDWYKQQPHLPQELDEFFDTRIKFMLRSNKMSVEKTKTKIDMYYTVRNFCPEFYENRHPKHPRIQKAMDFCFSFPIKKPLNHLTRLSLMRVNVFNPEIYDMASGLAASMHLFEMRANYDICIYDSFIVDYKNISLSIMLKTNPALMQKMIKVFEKAFSDRIGEVHFLFVPPYVHKFINLLKSFVKEKIAKRMHVHDSLESLYKHIPREILPTDYGGDDKSVDELQEDWEKFIEEHNDWFLRQEKLKSNEKLRQGKPLANDLFGIEGSFRKLEID